MAKRKKSTKKKVVTPLPKTITERGSRYTKSGSNLTKSAAKKAAKVHREKKTGNGATYKKDPKTKKWCLFTRGK